MCDKNMEKPVIHTHLKIQAK